MLKMVDRNAERWALLVLYAMLVITMAVEVVRREMFAYSSIWGEEIVRYAFIYLVWIGAASAVRERAHIRIDVLFHYVSDRVKGYLYVLGDLVTLGVALVAVYWSFETVAVSWKFGSVSHGLRVSLADRCHVAAARTDHGRPRRAAGFCVRRNLADRRSVFAHFADDLYPDRGRLCDGDHTQYCDPGADPTSASAGDRHE